MQLFYQHIKSALAQIYSESEIHLLYAQILEKTCGLSRARLLADSSTQLSDIQKKEVYSIIERLKNHEPIQYILGETEFYGLNFKVNSSVLIPRPETEELVEWIIATHCGLNGKILDIGTGSGCIPIALKKHFPKANISALDISTEALKVARENAASNNVDIDFVQADVLKITELPEKYDVIVSNPPYVLESDKREMQSAVLDYEPHSALFVPDADPLIFYRKIARLSKNHLKKNGKLYFEIHREQARNCVKLLESLDFKHVIVRKDLAGNDRMIQAER